MGIKGEDLRRGVGAFFGTLNQLQDREERREEREENKRYRDFYMKLQEGQDARSAENHAITQERWGHEQEQLVRDAEARKAFMAEQQMTPEAFELLAPARKFELYQAAMEMGQELNELQLETGRFGLQQSKQMAPYELAAARGRAAAANSYGRGGGGDDGVGDVVGQWKILDTRQKSIENRLEMHRNPLTKVLEGVPEDLLQSYASNSQLMTDLESQMIPGQRAALGLEGLGAIAGPVGGAGSSEEEDEFWKTRVPQEARRSPEEQASIEAARARQTNLSNRKAMYVSPVDGTLIATNDRKQVEQAESYARDKGQGSLEYFDPQEVPSWAVGKPVSAYRSYLKQKAETRRRGGIPASFPTGRVDPRAVGLGL